jgi:hypothetical protein
MKKVFFLLIILSVIFIGQKSFAQDTHNFSGYIETNYNYYLGDTTVNALRSYDAKANQILLNNVHLALSGTPSSKVSYVVELDFGTDAGVHGLLNQVGGGPAIGVDVQEAYMTYALSDKFKFTGGRFVTFEGIEVIEGPANPTISRGYLYGLAEAFTHVGGYFTFAASNKIDFKLGVVNGWDLLIDNNQNKTIIGRFGVNLGDPLAFGISGSWGVEQVASDDSRTSIDLTGVTKVIPGVTLNFQGNYGAETMGTIDATWMGFGLQPVIAFSDNIDLGARIEYFSDSDGIRSGTGIEDFNTLNLTLVPTFKYDSFTFRFEYRFDTASDEIFPVSEDTPSKSSSTISLGVSCNL